MTCSDKITCLDWVFHPYHLTFCHLFLKEIYQALQWRSERSRQARDCSMLKPEMQLPLNAATTWAVPAPWYYCMEILHNSSQDPSLSQTHNCVNHLGLSTVWNVTAASHFPSLSLSLSLSSLPPQHRDEWCCLYLVFDWQNKRSYHNSNAGRQTTSNNRGRQTHHNCDSVRRER